MAKIKCKECGEIFNANLEDCPNCGCPSSESDLIEEQQTEQQTKQQTETQAQPEDKYQGMGYVDVDSDNVFVGIFRWLSPSSILLPYNSKPTKITVAVDNDAEDVFEIEKSLFYILQAFGLKLFLCYVAFFFLVGAVYAGISYLVYHSCDDFDDYSRATTLMVILGIIGVVFCIIVAFMIFLYIFRPYWSHIHVRLRELHIRHWRNVYRAIKNDEQ